MQFKKHLLALCVTSLASTTALATDGMNLEGYGPIATAMGGASMAYDNGTAGMMNNPATLGLQEEGARVDLALGFLGPDVQVVGGQASSADAYFMPAAGYTRRSGDLTYGLGLFAQGGMGTEYAMGIDGQKELSELGVGRFILPLAYNVNNNLTLGGSLDFVWAMLDLKMAMPLTNMAGLITAPGNGTLMGALGSMMGSGYENARLDFANGNHFTGKAKGTGFAGKIGMNYKISNMASIGMTYHTKTHLSDMETGSGGAAIIVSDAQAINPTQTVPGKISVRDFEWPATFAIGISVNPTDKWQFAADVKRIKWKDVMENFTMTYSSMGDSVTFQLPQMWQDQTVFSFGAAYKATQDLTLRAGVNIADNPIPDMTMHYLFPAIEKDHYTAGFGYNLSNSSEINFSAQYAKPVKQTNSTFGYTVNHSQLSWQVMYSMQF